MIGNIDEIAHTSGHFNDILDWLSNLGGTMQASRASLPLTAKHPIDGLPPLDAPGQVKSKETMETAFPTEVIEMLSYSAQMVSLMLFMVRKTLGCDDVLVGWGGDQEKLFAPQQGTLFSELWAVIVATKLDIKQGPRCRRSNHRRAVA